MAQRTVTDSAGHVWICDELVTSTAETPRRTGVDVRLSCSTADAAQPVVVTIGSGWEQMAPNGLARIVSQAAQLPRR